MKTTFLILGFVLLFLFVGDFKITFSPFSIALPGWIKVIAWALLVAGLVILEVNAYRLGMMKGADLMGDHIIKVIEDTKQVPDTATIVDAKKTVVEE